MSQGERKGKAMSNLPETEQDAVSETERTLARMKSYTGAAVLVFFLYWLFYLPGLIVNYLYLREAKRMEKVAGQSLPSVGCLSVMLRLNLAAIAIAGGLLLAMIIFEIATSW